MTDKATRIDLFSLRTAPMRAFHLTWMAFFVCFFAWFACAPLMPLIAREFHLSAAQVANINIAAVAATIAVRLLSARCATASVRAASTSACSCSARFRCSRCRSRTTTCRS